MPGSMYSPLRTAVAGSLALQSRKAGAFRNIETCLDIQRSLNSRSYSQQRKSTRPQDAVPLHQCDCVECCANSFASAANTARKLADESNITDTIELSPSCYDQLGSSRPRGQTRTSTASQGVSRPRSSTRYGASSGVSDAGDEPTWGATTSRQRSMSVRYPLDSSEFRTAPWGTSSQPRGRKSESGWYNRPSVRTLDIRGAPVASNSYTATIPATTSRVATGKRVGYESRALVPTRACSSAHSIVNEDTGRWVSSRRQSGASATSSDDSETEIFCVNMPNLFTRKINLSKVSHSIQSSIQFLVNGRFPKIARCPAPQLPPMLPQDRCKPTLVLDMDETLMHCSTVPLRVKVHMKVSLDSMSKTGNVYVRPYAVRFLEEISKTYEVVVFTASTQFYADQVLDELDPERISIRHRLYRQNCTYVNGGYVKDLRILGRPMSRIVIADNSPISLGFQPDNGIIVSTWTGQEGDTELVDLLEQLKDMEKCDDFPAYLSATYGFRDWVNSLRYSRAL